MAKQPDAAVGRAPLIRRVWDDLDYRNRALTHSASARPISGLVSRKPWSNDLFVGGGAGKRLPVGPGHLALVGIAPVTAPGRSWRQRLDVSDRNSEPSTCGEPALCLAPDIRKPLLQNGTATRDRVSVGNLRAVRPAGPHAEPRLTRGAPLASGARAPATHIGTREAWKIEHHRPPPG